ncbi:glycosyltransferase [Treponema pectinovorum]|uniref:glycosyltransferase n=1 Tax=Treponema pectinovorum TaxID=164 RepID=UPI00164E4B55|nr:glycosyltransferase [Treponema pectinovorum]
MISIAMTTYNGSKYLQKQLDSILAQSISDFELIICDDNSNDGTFEILKNYEEIDSRIKIYRNENNLGFRKNFEKAISLSSGEYIALCDQDDIWIEDHLKILAENLKHKTASVGNAQIIDENDFLIGDLLSERDRYFVDGDDGWKLSRILLYGNPFQGTSSMYKKELFNYALPIPEKVEYHDAWFSAVACCMNGLYYTFEPITNYRIHSNNASGDHKISFFKQIANTLNRKEFYTDRLVFAQELKIRIPLLREGIKQILIETEEFYKNRNNKRKFKVMTFLIKNYKRIYSVSNYKQLVPRCIAILLRG